MGNVRRRPRGTLKSADYTQTNYTISKDSKAVLEAFADEIGVVAAAGLDKLLAHLKLEMAESPDGLPAWIDRSQIKRSEEEPRLFDKAS